MEIVKGNLIDLAEDGHFDVIVHGCNCFNTMGKGIAKEIRQRYPQTYVADCQTIKGDRAKLGNYTSFKTDTFTIVNAYCQYNYNLTGGSKVLFEYDAFRKALDKLQVDFPLARFGFPKIGCGLAHADYTVVKEMIAQFEQDLIDDLHRADPDADMDEISLCTIVEYKE